MISNDRPFSFDVLAAYTMAFSLATILFVRGLLGGSPGMLVFAGWVAISIPIAWARRRESLRVGRSVESPAAHIGLDGWGSRTILRLGAVAVLLALALTVLLR